MQNWFDDWYEQVQNTAPITTAVWSVDVPLSARVIDIAEPFEVITAFSSRLSEVMGWHTVGTSFICGFTQDESRYVEPTSESPLIWPARWSIVAGSAEQALRRFLAFGELINCIAAQDKWLPHLQIKDQLDVNSFTKGTRTFDPADLVTNHPLRFHWSDLGLDTIDHEVAVNQITRVREVQSLELRTSTVLEAKRSLEALVNLLPLVELDVYNWKWVVIAAHNSLQNFLIAALEGTSPGRVLVDSELPTSGRQSAVNINPTLIPFTELYDRVKNDEFMMQNAQSKKYEHKGNVGSSVSRLNNLRNAFTHFDPKTLVLGYDSILTLPQMLDDTLSLIHFLAFESHNVRWHVYPIEKVETKLLLDDVWTIVERIAQDYWKLTIA